MMRQGPTHGGLVQHFGRHQRSCWCARLHRVAGRQLVGTNGRIAFTLEGLTFLRDKAGARARGVDRVHEVGWGIITRAELTEPPKGKPVVRIGVADTAPVASAKSDPYALKVKRRQVGEAREFVALVNDEVDTRRRWQQ